MRPNHDYTETRNCLLRSVDALDRARRNAGLTNLPPSLPPGAIRAQIDHLEALIAEAAEEAAAARIACTDAGRRGLTVCK
jgi:hypothetical protein